MVDAFEQLPADASKKSVRSASTGIDSAKAHASRMSLQSKHELLSDTLPTQITANQSSRRPRGKVCVRGDGIGFQCCDSACQRLAKSDNSIWQPFAVCIGLQVLLGASAPRCTVVVGPFRFEPCLQLGKDLRVGRKRLYLHADRHGKAL